MVFMALITTMTSFVGINPSRINHTKLLLFPDPEVLKLPILIKPLHFYKDRSQAPAILREMNQKVGIPATSIVSHLSISLSPFL